MKLPNGDIQRILIVGNAAGGKTRLARKLSELYNLPVTHVDSIQFISGMNIRPLDETRKILSEVTARPQWIIDGHGPLDQIEKRFLIADRIVFVDLPITTHYWWLTKRQFLNLWNKRPELPDSCNEVSLKHTKKLIKSVWKIHKQMRPELIRIFSKDQLKSKVTHIKTRQQWDQVFNMGLE